MPFRNIRGRRRLWTQPIVLDEIRPPGCCENARLRPCVRQVPRRRPTNRPRSEVAQRVRSRTPHRPPRLGLPARATALTQRGTTAEPDRTWPPARRTLRLGPDLGRSYSRHWVHGPGETELRTGDRLTTMDGIDIRKGPQRSNGVSSVSNALNVSRNAPVLAALERSPAPRGIENQAVDAVEINE